MAETAKILSPEKTVLIPDRAGCSLASSISAADVRLLRERYPGTPVVTYVDTSAEVKAESDICCTSSNAVEIVESLGADRVIFLPDEFLGRYVAERTAVEIILWQGHCEVHERFRADELRDYRKSYPGIRIFAHPECPPDVLTEADYVGSTSGMIRHVDETRPERVVMVTECSMSDNVAVAHIRKVEFVRPCSLCPHMKQITLPKILVSLERMRYEVTVEPDVAERARLAVERMWRWDVEPADLTRDKTATARTSSCPGNAPGTNCRLTQPAPPSPTSSLRQMTRRRWNDEPIWRPISVPSSIPSYHLHAPSHPNLCVKTQQHRPHDPMTEPSSASAAVPKCSRCTQCGVAHPADTRPTVAGGKWMFYPQR